MTNVNRCVLAIAISLLGGCGSLPSGTGPDRLSDSALSGDKAIVLVSTGVPEACGAGADVTQLAIFPADATYSVLHMASSAMIDNHYVKSDFEDHPGNLHALQLAPGKYYLAPYTLRLRTKFRPGLRPVQIPKFDFTVAAGEVVYIGEFWLVENCQGEGIDSFRDQERRDMDLLAQKNPKLSHATIVKRIPSFSGFAVGVNPEEAAPEKDGGAAPQ
jgi:hypothetical protein